MDINFSKLLSYSLFILFGALVLAAKPLTFNVGSVNTSVTELLAFLALLYVVLARAPRSSPLFRPYLLLILLSIFPFIIGASANGIVQALRDFAQVMNVSFLFVGQYYFARNRIGPEKLSIGICWVASFFALLFLLNNHVFPVLSGMRQYFELGYRFIVGFAFFNLLARIIGIHGSPKINITIALGMILVLMAYSLEIRTRAHLLMLGVGGATMMLGYLFAYGGKAFSRLLLLGVVLILVIVAPITMEWVQVSVSSSGSLGRIMGILGGGITNDVTAIFRLHAWSLALEGFYESPVFGQGLGTYLYLDPRIQNNYSYMFAAMIHNQYIQVLFVGGVTHMAGYLYLFYKMFMTIGYRRPGEQMEKIFGRVLIGRGFLVGVLFYSAFGAVWASTINALFIWFILGYFCQNPKKEKSFYDKGVILQSK